MKINLDRQFSILFFIVALLLIGAGFVLQDRLEKTQSILTNLTTKSLPSLANASKTAVASSELLASLESLTQANSSVAQRIAEQEINNKLEETKKLASVAEDNTYEIQQLEAIQAEISNLTNQIQIKLSIASHIEEKLNLLWKLQIELEKLNRQDANSNNYVENNIQAEWQITFSQIITLGYITAKVKRLTDLHEVVQMTQDRLNNLATTYNLLPNKFKEEVTSLNDKLKNALSGHQSLAALQESYLRAIGRSRGEEHFIQNMISDYSDMKSHISFNKSYKLKEKAIMLNNDMNTQKAWLIGIFFLLVTMISAILLLYRRIIKRLKRVTSKINKMTNTQSKTNHNSDEIDELSQALNQFSDTINAQTQRLEALSFTDSLTNIANRRAFDQRLKLELENLKNTNLSILLIDVDFFKQYNDTYGHVSGDEALQKIAEALRSCINEETDLIARYGGEEFVAIFPATPEHEVNDIAKKIMEAIKLTNIEHSTNKVSDKITISIGAVTTELNTDVTTDSLMKQADIALYHSKAAGRARVTHINQID